MCQACDIVGRASRPVGKPTAFAWYHWTTDPYWQVGSVNTW